MPRIHPKVEVLDGLLRIFPDERERLLRYRLRDPRPRPKPGSGGREVLYDQAIEGVLDRFRPRIEAAVREMAGAPLLLAEILGSPPGRREGLARGGERFRSLALCRLLLDRSHEESLENPGEGERLAALALAITESLDPARYGDRVLADARARAWVAIADARRAAGDLWGSERSFRTAEEQLRQGLRDCLERAQLLQCKGSLRRAQRRFPEAARLLRRSISISLCTEQARGAALAILELARVEKDRGEPDRAVWLLDRAAGLVDPDEDERLHDRIRSHRIRCLLEAGSSKGWAKGWAYRRAKA
jgi:hypothetical protein